MDNPLNAGSAMESSACNSLLNSLVVETDPSVDERKAPIPLSVERRMTAAAPGKAKEANQEDVFEWRDVRDKVLLVFVGISIGYGVSVFQRFAGSWLWQAIISFGILGIIWQYCEFIDKRKRGEEYLKNSEEALAQARQRAAEIEADGRRRAGEIEEEAKAKTEEDTAKILKKAEDDGKAEAARIVSNARQKSKDLSSYFEAKAKELGITPAEWDEVLSIKEKTQAECDEKLAQAQAEADTKLKELLAQAQAKAAQLIEKELEKAKVEAANIVIKAMKDADQIEQGQEIPENEEPQEETQVDGGQPSQKDLPGMEDPDHTAKQVAALEEKILGILSSQGEMTKRELERRAAKYYYGQQLWDLVMDNLINDDKITYNQENKTYRSFCFMSTITT
jgi:F0F1-type ATP synthase membrane subunit b/b'